MGEFLACILNWLHDPKDELELLDHTPEGAPFFSGARKLPVSISHSGKWVVAAIGTEYGKIGVDIEELKEFDWNEVAQKFHVADKIALSSLAKSDAIIEFYRLWTAREAWVKCGQGTLLDSLGRCFSNPAWSDMRWSHLMLDSKNLCCICRTPYSQIEFENLFYVSVGLYQNGVTSNSDQFGNRLKIFKKMLKNSRGEVFGTGDMDNAFAQHKHRTSARKQNDRIENVMEGDTIVAGFGARNGMIARGLEFKIEQGLRI